VYKVAKENNMREFDFIIIGGGPAGAVFAKNLNEKYSACMIYTESQKPCGGLLSEDAQKYFTDRNTALPDYIFADSRITCVDTFDIDQRLARKYRRFYLNIDRLKFDDWLRGFVPKKTEKITGRAVKITGDENGFRVTYISGGKQSEVRGRYVIGADGGDSIVRKTFFPERKIRRYVSIQQSFRINASVPDYACIFDRKSTVCCAWIIRKGENMLFGGAFEPKDCRESFEKLKKRIEQYGIHLGQPISTEACMLSRPENTWQIVPGNGRVFLAGEAAGFVSPSSFEGISRAMYSGEILAKAFNTSRPLKYYKKHTAKLRFVIMLKLLKSPFMYSPFLRKAVMISGITAVKK
jgi:flavin-dependent dehydrogenase